MTGRSLHDALLRALTDAGLRRGVADRDSSVALALGSEETDTLKRADAERLRRLAGFMARHFYRERIVRLFRYNRALCLARGHDPLVVLESAEFGSVLDSAVLGSPATAEAVAELVEARLLADLNDLPYAPALVYYEGTLFRIEAGPRRWQASAASTDGIPVRSPHSRIIDLDWNLTPLIAALRVGSMSLPEPVREPTRLLVALSPRGRVTSVRCPDPILRLLDALDGRRGVAEAASVAGLSEAEAAKLVARLAEIGALQWRPFTDTDAAEHHPTRSSTQSWKEIQDAIWSCTACEGNPRVELKIRQQTESVPIPARILVVSLAPPFERGVTRETPAKSATNNPDDRLRQFLEEALELPWNELTGRRLALLHAVKCAIVPDKDGFQNPPRDVVHTCAPRHLAREFQQINPTVVVTLGERALRAILRIPGCQGPSELKLSTKSDEYTVRVNNKIFTLFVSPFFRGRGRARAAQVIQQAARRAGVITE